VGVTSTPAGQDTPVSFPARIRQLVSEAPGRTVLVHIGPDGTETELTWTELDRRSSQLAGALRDERSLGHGGRLALGLPNTPQLVLGALAAWKLGAVPVPLRWDLPDWERQRLRDVVEAKVHLDESDLAWIDGTADREVPDLPDVVSPSMNGICSSGSTGTPKVIVLSWPAVYNDVFSTPMVELWHPVPRPQVILVLSPMYHTNGFATLLSLLGGDQLVLLQRFDAARVVDLVERRRVSTFTATPTMLKRIADVPGLEERDLSSIEWILQGAAPMPPSLVDRWARLIGPERIIMAYGMTEAIGLTALRGDEWQQHRGSVGRGLRGTEIRILDPAGEELAPGEVGDIYLRSPSYGGSTYLGASPMPETRDGFATVGDMGRLDDDGYLYLADRRVDLIVSGGANVYPAEVETALIDHPGIADVVVIGLRDDEWGRRVHAVIEPRDPSSPPTLDDIAAFAKERLAAYKVPKSIEIVDALPRTAATKVNRGVMVAERGG
jgi:bile acid-coenzyme A ligase